MKIIIKNLQKKIPINPARIKKTILKVLSYEGAKLSGEITISFVAEKKIQELNKRFLGLNEPTDCLAFDMSEAGIKGGLLADIIISADEAGKNARFFKTTLPYELDLYAAHGLLHILGYDDHAKKDIKVMRLKERKYVHP